ncbi:MAG: hypothetical protein HUU49_01000 [Candidatus Buchananbacteria bacterium]|nr:hypothetical protein [Candidatus Buchananbacteria bacterium]
MEHKNKKVKIAICGSLDFTYEIEKLAQELRNRGFEVFIPISSEKILRGEVSLEEIKQEKRAGKFSERAIKNNSIREYWNIINECDCVLIANYDKKGIAGYVGGNVFLEMGFAHVLKKKIFLLHGVPDMIYSDEIKAMQPIVLNEDLSSI